MSKFNENEPLTTLRGGRIYGAKTVAGNVQMRLSNRFAGILNAMQVVSTWNVGQVLAFLKSCHVSDCGGDHELPLGQKVWNTMNCPWNSGANQGTNLGCCHALQENFQLQGAIPKIGAILYLMGKNNWLDQMAVDSYTDCLREIGGTLFKMDFEHRGKTVVPEEDLADFKRRQRDLGNIVQREVVDPLIALLS